MSFLEVLDSSLEEITPAYMRGIVAPLRSIDPALFDLDRSGIECSEEESAVIVRIFSARDLCCPLSIVFGTGDFSRFFHFSFGESFMTWEETIEDELEAENATRAFQEYLETEVTETRTMIEDCLAKITYSYSFTVDGRRQSFKDTVSRMAIRPWREKKMIVTTYRAWLHRS